MPLYATRNGTFCRGQMFQAGEEITAVRQPSDERLMRTLYGASDTPPDGLAEPPAAAPVRRPRRPVPAQAQVDDAATSPKAPRRPRGAKYRTRRLKAEG